MGSLGWRTRRSAHPSMRGEVPAVAKAMAGYSLARRSVAKAGEAKMQSPGAENAPRERGGVRVLEIARPGMEDSESAKKQENTGNGPASACRGKGGYRAERSVRTELTRAASCAGLTRASIFYPRSLTKWMDCRVKPGNDSGVCACAPRSATNKCTKWRSAQFPLFPIDTINENCNPNVFGLRGSDHPHMSPTMWHHPSVSPPGVIMWHHPSSSHVSPSVVIMCFAFEAPMSARRILINPPPGPRPR